jgi:cysteine desulfurase
MTTKEDIDAFVTALKEISKDFVIENTNVEHR